MFPILDLVATIGGLIIPPAVDFVKKKFLKPEQETPEATLSTLATTSPEVMPGYLQAITGYIDAKVRFFNRDVVGTASQWVIDLRAAIRPCGVIIAFAILTFSGQDFLALNDGVRLSCEAVISSWFGDRIVAR